MLAPGYVAVFERSPALRDPRRTVRGQTSSSCLLGRGFRGRSDRTKGACSFVFPAGSSSARWNIPRGGCFARHAPPPRRAACIRNAGSFLAPRSTETARACARCERTLSTADANRPGGRSTAAFGIPFRIWTVQKYKGRFIASRSRAAGLLLGEPAEDSRRPFRRYRRSCARVR